MQEELERQDRTQLAVTKAIASSILGVAQEFASLLFQEYLSSDEETPRPDRPFPYDVKFLPAQDIENLVTLATRTGHEAWPIERIDAYRGKDLCAKRAAVTAFLWQRYREDPTMTLEKLKLWHEIEELDQILQIPPWFRQQHIGQDIETLWNQKLGAQRKRYESRHQEVMQQILTM